MALENIPLMKRYMKANGHRAKSLEKEKLFLRVEVFSKDLSEMISKKGMERCTIILRETILKENGKTTRNKVKVQWTGLTFDKNMWVNGKITTKKDGECIYGSNPKAKESILETAMKALGWMELETALECFIMQMDQSMKDIGKITWKMDTPFTQTKTDRYNLFCSRRTEWSERTIQQPFRNRTRKGLLKSKFNLTFTRYV